MYFFDDHELFRKGRINNRLGGLRAFYGPLAVNYDWNIGFVGRMEHERIVGVTPAQAKAMELDEAGFKDCVPF